MNDDFIQKKISEDAGMFIEDPFFESIDRYEEERQIIPKETINVVEIPIIDLPKEEIEKIEKELEE